MWARNSRAHDPSGRLIRPIIFRRCWDCPSNSTVEV